MRTGSAAAEAVPLAAGVARVLRAAAFRHLRMPPSELPGAVSVLNSWLFSVPVRFNVQRLSRGVPWCKALVPARCQMGEVLAARAGMMTAEHHKGAVNPIQLPHPQHAARCRRRSAVSLRRCRADRAAACGAAGGACFRAALSAHATRPTTDSARTGKTHGLRCCAV